MTQDQLNAVVARTGHERLRSLTAESNGDVGQRDAYRRLVEQLAEPGSIPPRPAPSEQPAVQPHASYGGCCPPEPPHGE